MQRRKDYPPNRIAAKLRSPPRLAWRITRVWVQPLRHLVRRRFAGVATFGLRDLDDDVAGPDAVFCAARAIRARSVIRSRRSSGPILNASRASLDLATVMLSVDPLRRFLPGGASEFDRRRRRRLALLRNPPDAPASLSTSRSCRSRQTSTGTALPISVTQRRGGRCGCRAPPGR